MNKPFFSGPLMTISTILISALFILTGCSVHKIVNGSDKPGVAYVSLNDFGDIESNAKAFGYSDDLLSNSVKDKIIDDKKLSADKLVDLLTQIDGLTQKDTLFIWGADYNGAMINKDGQTCMQAASYARSTESSLDISASLLKVLKGIDLNNDNDKLIALKITESITTLQATSQQSTYLSAGLFGICILHANNALNQGEALVAINNLIKASELKIPEKNKEIQEILGKKDDNISAKK